MVAFDKIEIFDTVVSNTSHVKSLGVSYTSACPEMKPIVLSGNQGLIRLKSRKCSYFCTRARGYKLRIDVGKAKNIIDKFNIILKNFEYCRFLRNQYYE